MKNEWAWLDKVWKLVLLGTAVGGMIALAVNLPQRVSAIEDSDIHQEKILHELIMNHALFKQDLAYIKEESKDAREQRKMMSQSLNVILSRLPQ